MCQVCASVCVSVRAYVYPSVCLIGEIHDWFEIGPPVLSQIVGHIIISQRRISVVVSHQLDSLNVKDWNENILWNRHYFGGSRVITLQMVVSYYCHLIGSYICAFD